jgi:hypothetical protein
MKPIQWLACFVLWVMIAVPWAPITWVVWRPFAGGWSFNSVVAAIASVLVTAALGTAVFRVLDRGWAFSGGLLGGVLGWVLLRWLAYATPAIVDSVPWEILPWSVVGGLLSGGLWGRLRNSERALVLDEKNFLWTATAAWTLVLRLAQVVVASALMIRDALFIEELLVFPVVLVLSLITSKMLYRRLKGGVGRLILFSILSAFITQELAALIIFPVAVVVRGLAGTQAAFGLLAFAPGPGLVWGGVMGYLVWRSRK